jgi:metal-responsive CopG/Arc/MetJ family transcriptional regulator
VTKAKGGRGMKAENKYERFTASVPPHVLRVLDAYAARMNLNRSEALTAMVERHEKMWPTR